MPAAAPTRWTALVGAGLRARVAKRARRLRDRAWWGANTARIQGNQLGRLLADAARTEYGRAHDFDRIASSESTRDRVAAFRAAVPVRDWYAFKDEITRMREHAQRDVLWPGLVKHFAQTSGTTAGDKYIPVSHEMMRSNYRASLDIFANLINRGVPLTRIMSGRCLFLGGSSDLAYNEHSIATGDLSGLVTPLIRWPISAIYSPGPEIALMSDWPAKIEAMAELTLHQDIRMISGMPSWALVLIQRVLEKTGASCAREVWPNLEVFVHGGVRYEPFRARFARAYSGSPDTDIPQRLELYPASEGFVAMQDRAGDPGLRLIVDNGIFFEFVPREQIDDDHPEAFACWEVDKGQQYVVVLTTCAGLWRYVLGDVVEFDEVAGGGSPARVRIVGRHRHFINAFGENLIAEHIEEGVAAASGARA
ncbi:MAG: GH3 auxin-responsive promoter family protein [Phycisphaerales bacterium]